MSVLTGAATAVIGLAAVIGIWIWVGQDPESLIGFLQSNWSAVVLAVQFMAAVLLAAANRYIGAAVLTCSSLATLIGMVVA